MPSFKKLKTEDKEIYDATFLELKRQQNNIELIASENIVSNAVMEAMGSYLTNKYAEGYPGNRYYGGCEYVDIVENIAIERVKKLFKAEHANVQPHSGSQANMTVYLAMLELGDIVLAMNLSHGGHLTHGSAVNASGKYYNFVHYGIDSKTGRIDYDKVEELAKKHKPKLILAGASAYPRKIDFKRFSEIAKKIGAYFMVDMAHIAGLVVAGKHQNPVKYADFVTSTTHKTLRGPRGGLILCKKVYAKQIDKALFPGVQGGPLMHVIAGKAVCFKEAQTEQFNQYQEQVINNSKALAKELIKRGFNLISGGTDNHLVLIDLRNKKITGKELEIRLDQVGITVNKNSIPEDPESPFVTSGVRLGTPAVTTRGFREEEMEIIADLIDKAIESFEDSKESIKKQVSKMCRKYPIY